MDPGTVFEVASCRHTSSGKVAVLWVNSINFFMTSNVYQKNFVSIKKLEDDTTVVTETKGPKPFKFSG
jgi:hypothetical protein